MVDLPGTQYTERLEAAIPLAIKVAAWLDNANEQIPPKPMAAKSKLAAEEGLAETKVILGWHFNFRTLTVTLPKHKYTAWSNKIQKMMDKKKTLQKTLESTICQMGHVGFVIPWVFHFLSHLQTLVAPAQNMRFILIDKMSRIYLELMLLILKKAKDGNNMNLLAFWLTNQVYYSDSCPTGLGGYSNQRHAWHFKVPNDLWFPVTINLLKFIATVITPRIDIINGRLLRGVRSIDDQQHDRRRMDSKIQFRWANNNPTQATSGVKATRHYSQ